MKDELSGKRILFANVPTDGHFNPLTGLAKELQKSGCDVHWYTSKIFGNKLERLDIVHHQFTTAKELNGQNIQTAIPEFKTATGPEKGKLYLKNLFIDRAEEYFEDISAIYNSEFRFDLIVADGMFSALPLVRYKLGVPVIAVGVVPLIEDSIDTAPAGRGLPPAYTDELRQHYADLYKQKYRLIEDLIVKYRSDLNNYGVKIKGSFIFDSLVKEANIYLQIGTPGFEYKRSDMGNNIRFVGALKPYKAPGNQMSWFDERLNNYKKIVLVTQGTLEGDVNKLLVPVLHAFKSKDILVIATTGGSGTKELREKYGAENIIVEDFIPFDDIMPYVSVFITNGGYGGTILSISYGVPMVCAGVLELKNEINARVEHFGLGIDLKTESPTPQAIFAAANLIMKNPSYRNNTLKLNEEMRNYNSLDLCKQSIEELLR
ncbi:glycosyltransferase [Mucilaginibacter gynuensis]|uniref:Glycosyltransferase n=1 Tax=Mucilaginibacter gynuensis TaxID=1302236 RepID=A0ABP8GLJ3_9SPHI